MLRRYYRFHYNALPCYQPWLKILPHLKPRHLKFKLGLVHVVPQHIGLNC